MAGRAHAMTRHSGRSEYDRMAMGERILDARNRGETMPAIVAAEGISLPTGYRYLRAALDRREIPAVEEFRKQQNDALDQIERENREQIDLAEHVAREGAKSGNLSMVLQAVSMRSKALDTRLRIAERRARLNGLDAPVQVQATVTHLDAVDAELADLVRQAEQAAEQTRPDAQVSE